MTTKEIDWSVFDGYPQGIVYCRCGEVYSSHAKSAFGDDGKLILRSRKDCPGCGSPINIWKISSEPELMTFDRGDVGKIKIDE